MRQSTYSNNIFNDKVDFIRNDTRPNMEILTVLNTQPDYSSPYGATHIQYEGRHRNVGSSSFVDIGSNEAAHILPTTAVTLDVVSSSANDIFPSGSGVNLLLLIGLDNDFNHLQEVVALNGTTTVTTTNSFIRLNQVVILNSGSQNNGAGGDIQITNSDIWAQCFTGELGFFIGSYTVPAGHTLIARNLIFWASEGADIEIRSFIDAPASGVPFNNPLTFYVNANSWSYEGLPFPIPEKATLFFRGKTSSGGQTRPVSVTVNGIVYKNSKRDQWNQIIQPEL